MSSLVGFVLYETLDLFSLKFVLGEERYNNDDKR